MVAIGETAPSAATDSQIYTLPFYDLVALSHQLQFGRC